MNRIRIAALTSGLNTPSSRFRVRQYTGALADYGQDLIESTPRINQHARLKGSLSKIRARYMFPVYALQPVVNFVLRFPGIINSHESDITWIERNFVPYADSLAGLLKKPIVLDIDDAIWEYNKLSEKSTIGLIKLSDHVFAGNDYIANWVGKYTKNVSVVPTAIDTDRFHPDPERKTEVFTIGWTGTSSNFKYLYEIEKPIHEFLLRYPGAVIHIISDQMPNFRYIASDRVKYNRWTPENEVVLINDFDIGIMPIDDSNISKGKCSFKMLQYMAMGKPVIVSPYGMNYDVLRMGDVGLGPSNNDEWFDCLEYYYNSYCVRQMHGENGKRLILDKFSVNKVAKIISSQFSSMV